MKHKKRSGLWTEGTKLYWEIGRNMKDAEVRATTGQGDSSVFFLMRVKCEDEEDGAQWYPVNKKEVLESPPLA